MEIGHLILYLENGWFLKFQQAFSPVSIVLYRYLKKETIIGIIVKKIIIEIKK